MYQIIKFAEQLQGYFKKLNLYHLNSLQQEVQIKGQLFILNRISRSSLNAVHTDLVPDIITIIFITGSTVHRSVS